MQRKFKFERCGAVRCDSNCVKRKWFLERWLVVSLDTIATTTAAVTVRCQLMLPTFGAIARQMLQLWTMLQRLYICIDNFIKITKDLKNKINID